MQVSGKRKRRQPQGTTSIKLSTGRPLKAPQHLASTQKKIVLSKLQQHHKQTQRKMDRESDKLSTLEKLPVELIQQIFFHALEVNLPRASEHLRQVLSTERIFNALITFAYFDDDGASPVENTHFLPADYRMLNTAEKVRLQQSIFSCRWCTYSRLKSCLPALSRLVMVQAWHQEHEEDESHAVQNADVAQQSEVMVPNEAFRGLAVLPRIDDEPRLEQHFLARASVEQLGSSHTSTPSEDAPFFPRIVTWTSSLDDHGTIHKSTDRSVTTLATRQIPDWLLRSKPWTDERIRLLQLLRQGYTFIQDDHVMSISAQAVFDGMRNAIHESNVSALKTLLELHSAFFKSGAWTIQTMMSSQLTQPSHHPFPLDIFHLAVEQDDKATEMMSLLVRAGIDSLPRDDEVITAWAIRGSRSGNVLAMWLLKHMEGTADYGLPRRVHLFVDGSISWRARARGSSPFPETSFATELGYLAGTTISPAGVDGGICGAEELPV